MCIATLREWQVGKVEGESKDEEVGGKFEARGGRGINVVKCAKIS